MGTPDFAVPVLEALAADERNRITLVLTRPDAASGRGKTLLPSPVRARAEALGLPIATPTSLCDFRLPLSADAAGCSAPSSVAVPDFIIVAAFGLILPKALLALPRYGCINVHASLLPRWRGAAPIQRALLAGDERAGVSIMRMEAGLDTGAFCATASTEIGEKGAAELTAELAQLGARSLAAVLPALVAGTAEWVEQDESQVTYAEKLLKSELTLDPSLCATDNIRRIRASTPQAPARCTLCSKPVTVLEVRRVCQEMRSPNTPEPGTVLFEGKHLYLCAKDDFFELVSLKPDGKKEMAAGAFCAGLRDPNLSWSKL